jgi:rhodanese-related sulfurtransferase
MERLIDYANHHPWLAGALVLVSIVVVLYEMRSHSETKASVSPQDMVRLMNQGALLIDLRPLEQYTAGHVGGARQMSGEQILQAADTLKKYKEKAVVVYDDSGSLSAAAVRQLVSQGFTKAFNLRGGLAAWRTENLPLTRGEKA